MFDMPRFAKNMGNGLHQAWLRWVDGKGPGDIDIIDNVTWLGRSSHTGEFAAQFPF